MAPPPALPRAASHDSEERVPDPAPLPPADEGKQLLIAEEAPAAEQPNAAEDEVPEDEDEGEDEDEDERPMNSIAELQVYMENEVKNGNRRLQEQQVREEVERHFARQFAAGRGYGIFGHEVQYEAYRIGGSYAALGERLRQLVEQPAAAQPSANYDRVE